MKLIGLQRLVPFVIPLVSAACDGKLALTPLEGEVRRVACGAPDLGEVVYTFQNDGFMPVRVPQVTTDCACVRPVFSATEVLPNGGLCTLALSLPLVGPNVVTHSAQLKWASGAITQLVFTFEPKRQRRLLVRPQEIPLSVARLRESVVFEVAIDYYPGSAPGGGYVDPQVLRDTRPVQSTWERALSRQNGLAEGTLYIASSQLDLSKALTLAVVVPGFEKVDVEIR